LTSSPFRRAITACGVRAGAASPYQPLISKPLNPDSSSVGRSGSSRERFNVETARPRIRPDLSWGNAAPGPEKSTCTSLLTSAVTEGPDPR
jgi:hypothetical protein